MMWRDCALPDWVRARLVATVYLICFAHIGPSGLLDRLGTDLANVAALAGAATLWTGTASEARGRTITWEPTGATVHARPEDVAEALNILLNNVVTHGGAASSVAVAHANEMMLISVSDQGPGVPPEWRDQIFHWGVHSAESPGQGISLNLARRSMSEQGGSLRLAEPTTEGSPFVVRLPAARRSEESHARDARR